MFVLNTLLLLSVCVGFGVVMAAPLDANNLLDTTKETGTQRVVCYFNNWAWNRPGEGSHTVEDIDPFLCTHVLYAFAYIEEQGTELIPTDPEHDFENYQRLNALKLVNPGLRTLLAVGGADMCVDRWEFVTSNPGRIQQFARNVVSYITEHGFDGVDIDWEYPTSETRDKFTELLEGLREEFYHASGGRLVLTAALSATRLSIYNLPVIHHYLDFANVMTYDYHGYWGLPGTSPGTTTYFHSALYGKTPAHNLAQNWTLQQYLAYGFPRDKFVLGVPTYGRSFTLSDPDNHGVGAPASGPGDMGDHTQEAGALAYYEICLRLIHADYHREYRSRQEVPYAYAGDQWVGYDDIQSVYTKIQYAHDQNLAGVMFWDLSQDDFSNMCGRGRYPLIRLAKQALSTPTTTTTRRTLPTTTTRRTLPTTTTRRTLPTTTTRRTLPSTTTRRTLPSTTTRRTLPTTTTRRQLPTTTTRRSILPVQCQYDGQCFRHPVDCFVYYMCDGGVPYQMQCAPSTVFDTFRNICDHPVNVDCSLNPTPNPAHDGVTDL